MNPRTCPVRGCIRIAGPGKLMCWTCWRRVPGRLQRAVYRTYRAWLDLATSARAQLGAGITREPYDPDYLAARRAYDEAAKAAIDRAAA